MLSASTTPSATAIPDSKLIKSAIDGDAAAFSRLYEEFKNLVMHQLVELNKSRQSRQFLEDVSQEAWKNAYRGITKLDNPESFRPWLRKIVTNAFLNSLSRSKSKIPHITIDANGRTTDRDSSTTIFAELIAPPTRITSSDQEYISKRIFEAYSALSDDHKRVFDLRFDQDLQPQKIARELKIPDGTARSRLNAIKIHFARYFPDLKELFS